MKHKVSDLEGALLDAAVAKAEGWRPVGSAGAWGRPTRVIHTNGPDTTEFLWASLRGWSSDWQHGGPIIERERIEVHPGHAAPHCAWWATHPHEGWTTKMTGPTPLIAAMRAYVSSRFGEKVELP